MTIPPLGALAPQPGERDQSRRAKRNPFDAVYSAPKFRPGAPAAEAIAAMIERSGLPTGAVLRHILTVGLLCMPEAADFHASIAADMTLAPAPPRRQPRPTRVKPWQSAALAELDLWPARRTQKYHDRVKACPRALEICPDLLDRYALDA